MIRNKIQMEDQIGKHITTKQIFITVCHISKVFGTVETPQMQIQISDMKKNKLSLFFTCCINVIYSDDNNVNETY
jgi:hypothetical protein